MGTCEASSFDTWLAVINFFSAALDTSIKSVTLSSAAIELILSAQKSVASATNLVIWSFLTYWVL